MDDLRDALVKLTAPDGTELLFRYGATLPYAGKDYVVLLEMEDTPEGEEQILITRLHDDGETMSFEVVEEEDIIEHVFDKYVQMTTRAGLEGLEDAEQEAP